MNLTDRYMRGHLKLRHLQLLVALDDLRSVGRVAAYLNVSQPAVSKTLTGLEQGLNATLFYRGGRGMEPTEHGQVLLRHAREILGRLNQAKEELLDLSEGRMTRLHVGILPAASIQLIPRLISRLASTTPAVAISVREGTMGSLLPAMRAGELDMAVGLLPAGLPIELSSEILYDDRIVAVVRPEHPLAQCDAFARQDIAGYPLLLPPQGSILRTPIDAYLSEYGLELPRQHVESVSTLTNIGVLQYSDSVAFLSAEMARHYVAQGVLRVLPLNISRLTLHVGLSWMTDRGESVAVTLLRRLLHETCQEMQPAMQAFRTQLETAMPSD